MTQYTIIMNHKKGENVQKCENHNFVKGKDTQEFHEEFPTG